MTDQILEPETCSECGGEKRPPFDGRWRWARGGKVFDDIEIATLRAANLQKRSTRPYEYTGALDPEGRARIATRRTA